MLTELDPGVMRRIEYKLLCRAVNDATRLLQHGDPCAGYRCLLAGFSRACEMEAQGEQWAREIVDDYRVALFHYSRLYPADSPPPLQLSDSEPEGAG
ncbi:MAG: hypothetical protein ACK47B_11885 [Armatimonadota bacterium]